MLRAMNEVMDEENRRNDEKMFCKEYFGVFVRPRIRTFHIAQRTNVDVTTNFSYFCSSISISWCILLPNYVYYYNVHKSH